MPACRHPWGFGILPTGDGAEAHEDHLGCLPEGGAGKTTIATNLAVPAERAGHPTVLLNLDPQATAAK